MKQAVTKVLGEIQAKAMELETNIQEIDRLKATNLTLKSEIKGHSNDLEVFAKYLSEDEVKDLGIGKEATSTKKPTFAEIILGALAGKKLKTSEELFELYKKKSGKADMAYTAFNNNLKRLLEAGKVGKHQPKSANSSREHLVGLPAMFDGDKLKEEHLTTDNK